MRNETLENENELFALLSNYETPVNSVLICVFKLAVTFNLITLLLLVACLPLFAKPHIKFPANIIFTAAF